MTSDNPYNFTPLQTLLPRVIRKYNLERQTQGAHICHEFRKIAATLWNNNLHIHESIKAQSYQKGILTLKVANAGWAQEVQFKKIEILNRLNETFQNLPIKIRILQ